MAVSKATNTIKRKRVTPKQNSKDQLLWGSLALVAIGTAGYFGWRHFRLRSNRFENFEVLPITDTQAPRVTRSVNTGFPLRQGSRGSLVKQLQQALIKKYGSGILPKFGADGIWGNETQQALLNKGLPTTISQSEFSKITRNSTALVQNSFNPVSLARQLAQGINTRNFSIVDGLLARMNSVNDYNAVNTQFKTIRLFGIRHTLVNALLKFFKASSQQEKIRAHLTRMGLKYDGSKWSLFGLNGLGEKGVITLRPTSIWDGDQTAVEVPANLYLGREIASSDGFTRFETLDNHELFVHTNAITYTPANDTGKN